MKKLTSDELTQRILPTIVRLAVEIEDGKKIRLDFLCPVLSLLQKLIHVDPNAADEFEVDDQQRAIHLAKLLHTSLERADEVLQLDGPAAVGYAAGYLAGETCVSPLFSSDENWVADQAAAEVEAAGIQIFHQRKAWEAAVDRFEAFRAGFVSRRDELRREAKATGK